MQDGYGGLIPKLITYSRGQFYEITGIADAGLAEQSSIYSFETDINAFKRLH